MTSQPCAAADAAAEGAAAATTTFAALPPQLVSRIFELVPADSRLRCREVHPSWRDALADPALWARQDLSRAGGVERPFSAPLLYAAAARASGRLEVLKVPVGGAVSPDALLGVCRANAATLTELSLDGSEFESATYLHVVNSCAQISAALASCTLTSVELLNFDIWRVDRALNTMTTALTAHPTLQSLSIFEDRPTESNRAARLGIALLLSEEYAICRKPRLQELHVDFYGDFTSARSLFTRLPRNTHLRAFTCVFKDSSVDDAAAEGFSRDVLLPAMRATTSLQYVFTNLRCAEVREAMEFLQQRRAESNNVFVPRSKYAGQR